MDKARPRDRSIANTLKKSEVEDQRAVESPCLILARWNKEGTNLTLQINLKLQTPGGFNSYYLNHSGVVQKRAK